METLRKKNQLHNVILTVLVAVVFVGLFCMGNYGTAGDSASYLTMGITREPLYPMLLALLQGIFGKERFYIPLALLQNLFACVSVLCLTGYFGKKIFGNRLGQWLSAFVLTMPYLMTPVFSRSHLVMANKIMAEGITLPGYYFFVLYLLKIIYEENKLLKNTVVATGISLLLILARGQLLLTVIILGMVLGIRFLSRKEYKRLYVPVIIMLALFIGNSVFTGIYHYVSSGIYTATASSKPMILANVLYVSKPEDGDAIEDVRLKELFNRTYAALDKEGMLYIHAEGGMIDKALHHEACHDTISFDYFEPIKNEIYYPDGVGDPRNTQKSSRDSGYVSYMLAQDEIASALTKELISHNWSRYLSNYVNVCVLGLVRSIAVEQSILNVYAFVAYIMGIVVLFYVWKQKGFTGDVFFFGMTYIMIGGFVAATSLFLQCITRYMIYNLPFFYLAGTVLLFRLFTLNNRPVRK